MRGGRVAKLAGAVSLATGLIGACGGAESATELMVVVDADHAVPTELDAIEITISGADRTTVTRNADLAGPGAIPFPVTLGVVHRGGALSPVVVTARGMLAGVAVQSRRADTGFIAGEVRVLTMHLSRRCLTTACDVGSSCTENGCEPDLRDGQGLPRWSGVAPRLGDGLADAGPGCEPELCNHFDDDCDGQIDEDFDLVNDPQHCGSCDLACHETQACASSTCGCRQGLEDCDGRVDNGCEIDLDSDPQNCGRCGRSCGGFRTCTRGDCGR